MKKVFSVLVLLICVWSLSAQNPLQEIPADCIVYFGGNSNSIMNDPVTGRMICMFLTKNQLKPRDLCCKFAGGITVDGSAKIVAFMQTPNADQVVRFLFKEGRRKNISVSPDKRKITFLSATPRNGKPHPADKRKEFLQIIGGMKNPVFVLAFLGTDVPEGMEDNLIWSGLQRYADKVVFSVEERPEYKLLCRIQLTCPSAKDAESCRKKLHSVFSVISNAEESTAFTDRIQINRKDSVLSVSIVIQRMELISCALRLKLLMNHFNSSSDE